jgi:hypothetical protein
VGRDADREPVAEASGESDADPSAVEDPPVRETVTVADHDAVHVAVCVGPSLVGVAVRLVVSDIGVDTETVRGPALGDGVLLISAVCEEDPVSGDDTLKLPEAVASTDIVNDFGFERDLKFERVSGNDGEGGGVRVGVADGENDSVGSGENVLLCDGSDEEGDGEIDRDAVGNGFVPDCDRDKLGETLKVGLLLTLVVGVRVGPVGDPVTSWVAEGVTEEVLRMLSVAQDKDTVGVGDGEAVPPSVIEDDGFDSVCKREGVADMSGERLTEGEAVEASEGVGLADLLRPLSVSVTLRDGEARVTLTETEAVAGAPDRLRLAVLVHDSTVLDVDCVSDRDGREAVNVGGSGESVAEKDSVSCPWVAEPDMVLVGSDNDGDRVREDVQVAVLVRLSVAADSE